VAWKRILKLVDWLEAQTILIKLGMTWTRILKGLAKNGYEPKNKIL